MPSLIIGFVMGLMFGIFVYRMFSSQINSLIDFFSNMGKKSNKAFLKTGQEFERVNKNLGEINRSLNGISGVVSKNKNFKDEKKKNSDNYSYNIQSCENGEDERW